MTNSRVKIKKKNTRVLNEYSVKLRHYTTSSRINIFRRDKLLFILARRDGGVGVPIDDDQIYEIWRISLSPNPLARVSLSRGFMLAVQAN